MCACVHTQVCVHICMHDHWSSGVAHLGFLVGLRLTYQTKLDDPQAPEVLTPRPPSMGIQVYTTTGSLLHGFWGQNSALHIYTASIVQMMDLPSGNSFTNIFSSVVLSVLPPGCTPAPGILLLPFVLIMQAFISLHGDTHFILSKK